MLRHEWRKSKTTCAVEIELYKIFCSKPGSHLWAEMQVTGCMRDFDIRHQSVSLSLSVHHLFFFKLGLVFALVRSLRVRFGAVLKHS